MKRVLHSPKDRDEIYQRFIAYVEEWKVRLLLREWTIDTYLRTSGDDKAGPITTCRPEYHEISIVLRLPDSRETCWTDTELETDAVHELMHALLSTWDAMWQRSHKKLVPQQVLDMLLLVEEQSCTRLAEGFMRTKYPRRKAHKLTD